MAFGNTACEENLSPKTGGWKAKPPLHFKTTRRTDPYTGSKRVKINRKQVQVEVLSEIYWILGQIQKLILVTLFLVNSDPEAFIMLLLKESPTFRSSNW